MKSASISNLIASVFGILSIIFIIDGNYKAALQFAGLVIAAQAVTNIILSSNKPVEPTASSNRLKP